MASTPLVANEAPTGTTGSDGVAAFTFGADIDRTNHRIVVDRLEQGNTIDYAVTGARQVTFVAGSIPVVGAKVWLFNGVAGVTGTTGLPGWPTVADVVSRAAKSLGLTRQAIADPFASVDSNVVQLLELLQSGGDELVQYREWKHLQKEFTFSTVAGTEAYPLPSDYRSVVDDSEWNRTSQRPMNGPTSGPAWQQLRAINVTPAVSVFYRLWLGQLFLFQPSDAQLIAFEYHSSSWVRPVGQAQPTSSQPAAATDVLCFNRSLLVARLKMDFRRAKKQDSASEQDDYERALSGAEHEDAQGTTIYIGGRPLRGARRLDRYNLPETIR